MTDGAEAALARIRQRVAERERLSLEAPIPLSPEERIALATLKLLVERGVIRPA